MPASYQSPQNYLRRGQEPQNKGKALLFVKVNMFSRQLIRSRVDSLKAASRG